MKSNKRKTCDLCGKEAVIVIGGDGQSERLCLQCFIAANPVLKQLAEVV